MAGVPSPNASSHHVPSTDGVSLALHDLGGDGPPVLLCHPTGFHGLTWVPVAEHLTRSFHCWALDFRGHGDSTVPAPDALGWDAMAEDVLAVVAVVAPDGRPVLGVGHSMGGAALLLAEQERPATVAALWIYEPIVFPPSEARGSGSPLAESARRRRAVFPGKDAAVAHYASKPPLDRLDPAALRAYVDHGFRDLPDGTVTLKCAPGTEARVFEMGGHHRGFTRLGDVAVPTTVAFGGDGGPPAQLAPTVAERLPNGSLRPFPALSHFGPMEDAAAIASAITPDFVAFS